MISLPKIIKAMETQPKTPEKRGKIKDLSIIKTIQKSTRPIHQTKNQKLSLVIMWWGGWSPHHFSFHYYLCLGMSILRHLHTRIRESILSISLSNRLSRAIGQSPYQSRILIVTSRCVYRLLVSVACLGVYVCVFGCFLSIIALQSCLFQGTPPSLPQYHVIFIS